MPGVHIPWEERGNGVPSWGLVETLRSGTDGILTIHEQNLGGHWGLATIVGVGLSHSLDYGPG